MTTEKQDKIIRKRVWYKRFKEMAEKWAQKWGVLTAEQGLRDVYTFMDNAQAFGTETASSYAKESLELVIEELK